MRLHFHFSLSCIGEGNGNPLQCSCLENHRDRWAAISGVAQSRTRLKRLSSSSSIYIPGEGNGNHSSIFAWKTPWTEESGELQSVGSQRVEHDWATNTYLLIYIYMYNSFLDFFSYIDHCRVLSRVPCAIQQYLSILYTAVCLSL